LIERQQLFGIPVYKSRIDSSRYDKQVIIDTIARNYAIDPKRNAWDGVALLRSDLHHSFGDWENDKFEIINFDSLSSLYETHIRDFLHSLDFKSPYKYQFSVVNYTCYGKDQFMLEHEHLYCDFSAVHYLKYNPKVHNPTVYTNPAYFSPFTTLALSEKLVKDTKINLYNSWLTHNFHLGVAEDDFVITPGVLRHQVPMSTSDELRMALVINIKLEEPEK
jgi:hypothetical protein